jgi:hypothetical protein
MAEFVLEIAVKTSILGGHTMKKEKYDHLQHLLIAQSALLTSLIQEMNDKGLIDGNKVMDEYDKNLNLLIDDLKFE